MRDLELVVKDIKDPLVRDNLDRLQEFADKNLFSKFKGRHVSITLRSNKTYSYPHNLGFKPLDVIQTSLVTGGSGTLVWNYSAFSKTNLNFTVAGLAGSETLTVRAFIGSYVEQ